MGLRIATLIIISSGISNTTSTGAVTKERLCGGLLGKRVAQLSSARMNEVCAAVRFSVGCDSN
jgi:mRNA-degrading endonuclease toxin of MazEF toxin-antitoxin module